MTGSERRKWRFLNTGLRDGAFNMALDRALVESVASGASKPVIRFFGWNPPAVSLGYNQRSDGLDLQKFKDAGFDIVRRPTGGRAVIHQDEFTYSVIALENDALIGGAVLETYRIIANGLLAGLEKLGVKADIAKSTAPQAKGRASALCFAAAGRYEITVGNKKLVGSAQRRLNGVILQQGSLLLSCRQGTGSWGGNETEIPAGTLNDILGREVSFDEVSSAMEGGFREAWGVDFIDEDITAEEMNLALRLKSDSCFYEK